MKRNLHLLLLLCIALLASACKKQGFLDNASTGLTEDEIFTDSVRTMGFVTNIYADVNVSFNPRRFDQTGLFSATDEAEGSKNSSSNTYLQFVSGSVNPSLVSGEMFSTCYTKIRAVNKMLSKLPTSPFSQDLRNRVRGEVMFLRAWYYFQLVKHYGGVPLVGDKLYGRNEDIPTARATYEDCVNYITSQCDSAARFLKDSYDQLNYGRATTGACMALKARVLLYAASPLFNYDRSPEINPLPHPFAGYAHPELVGYTNYSKTRWKDAADAALKVMEMGYSLFDVPPTDDGQYGLGFYRVFDSQYLTNELIFRGSAPSAYGNALNQTFDPPSRGGFNNLNGSYPYQQMVDAFGMQNGKPITDPASGYNPDAPYQKRDPRLAYTIRYNGQLKWRVNEKDMDTVYTYVGARDDGIYVGTATGYYINKMIRDSSSANDFFTGTNRFYPLLRYAEVLLNYAEALNESEGVTNTVYEQLIAIRKRAGIDEGDGYYGLKRNMTQQEMRLAIQAERRVELAYEEHRFWDVRRWLIADVTESQLMNGMEIRNLGGNKYNYRIFPVRQHVFARRTYLWPFKQSEVSKPGGLQQNPGY